MKAAGKVLLSVALLFAFALAAQADEGKKQTLTGNIVCGKCTLKKDAACSNVLQVTKDGKTTNYWIKDDGKDESYHQCKPNSKKKVKVTGTVVKKDGKMWIEDPKVEEAD